MKEKKPSKTKAEEKPLYKIPGRFGSSKFSSNSSLSSAHSQFKPQAIRITQHKG